MKKILLYSLALCLTTFGLTSCNDDEDQYTDSRVTYYVSLEMQGDEVVYVNLGDTYTDAGCKAFSNGEDVSSQVVTSSDVNTSELGVYHVNYKAVNKDGFSSTATRTVYVGTPLTGVVSNGTYRLRGETTTPYSGYELFILSNNKDTYFVEDLLGGYYYLRAGYGSGYAMPGYIQVQPDNSVNIVKGGGVPEWGDAYSKFSGTYDAATNTISMVTTYAGMDFYVILKLN